MVDAHVRGPHDAQREVARTVAVVAVHLALVNQRPQRLRFGKRNHDGEAPAVVANRGEATHNLLHVGEGEALLVARVDAVEEAIDDRRIRGGVDVEDPKRLDDLRAVQEACGQSESEGQV